LAQRPKPPWQQARFDFFSFLFDLLLAHAPCVQSTFLHTIFGTDGQIPAKYLDYFLRKEMLPTPLGWNRSST
jgi:hypothetical protein